MDSNVGCLSPKLTLREWLFGSAHVQESMDPVSQVHGVLSNMDLFPPLGGNRHRLDV